MRAILIAAAASLAALGAAASVDEIVGQKDKQFSRDALTVKAGDKVTFVNDDTVAHNITVRDPSGANKVGTVQKPGEKSEVVFDKMGDHDVLRDPSEDENVGQGPVTSL